MALSPSSDPSSLPEHLTTLYPFACLLAGPDEAPNLLLRAYQNAAECPPAERPDDQEGWLLDLLFEARERPAPADEASTDSLRQEVSAERLDDVLPIALALCPPRDRFLLAVDAVRESSTTPAVSDAECQQARTRLLDRLETVLSGPEADLVAEEVSDDALRDAVREWTMSRFGPVPGSLRSQVRALLETTSFEGTAPEEDDHAESTTGSSLLHRLPARPRPRALLFTILLGGLVLAGGIGVWYATQPASAPSASGPGLVAFSAERAASIAPEQRMDDPSEAARYVESSWNRHIEVPVFKGASLRGVGRLRTNGAEIPVILYTTAGDGARVAIFAYNYALLHQIQPSATLNTRVRARLAKPERVMARPGTSAEGLLWRNRDEIFVAVAPSVATDSLQAWLRP